MRSVDKIENGGEALASRQGEPAARLVRVDLGFDREKARRAADGLRAASKGLTLAGLSIKELVASGRPES